MVWFGDELGGSCIIKLGLASCNLKTFPDFLRYQSRIIWKTTYDYFNISHNLLTELEEPLRDSFSVFSLDLHHNKLQGPIPAIPKEACFLDYSSNKFSSFIPRDIVLDLFINNISGTIPSCLVMMTGTLEVLNLKNNNLWGPIPDLQKYPYFEYWFCGTTNNSWEMLQIVDIAFNNFSGKLPGKFFGTWKRNVTHNKDEAGPKFIEKKYLLYTNVYYQDSASVTVINKGQEMELVKILTIFTSIDLSSSNHFEGPIPDDLMDLKILHIFNLSNNDLSGEIPSSINNLKQLESLDLSQNSLSGEIPIQLTSLSFLSYLNLTTKKLPFHVARYLHRL
ncbi:Receptor-like protein 54 [Glycine soja]|uniref:Receptor-like protein 54 n=1 Tax=Glycine soja TaxID=3848 RepID=A0A445L7I1_GLYSO|nr:Receptor-like protein 54 [Glycine soja]